MQVKKIMHQGLDRVAPDCSVEEAAAKMKRLNIGALPVCDGDVLLGVVTDRDIVVRVVARGTDPAATKVGKVMTRYPLCCYEEAELPAVARMMEERKIRRIPVVDREERLVGMLSIDDFARRGPAQDLLADVLASAAARHS